MLKREIIDVDAFEDIKPSNKASTSASDVIEITDSDSDGIELVKAPRASTLMIKGKSQTPHRIKKRRSPHTGSSVTSAAPPAKRRATASVPIPDEDDDDYETIHAGYDIRNGKSWRPLHVKDEEEEKNLDKDFASFQHTDEQGMVKRVSKKQIKSGFTNFPYKRETRPKRRLWDHLSALRNSVVKISKDTLLGLEHRGGPSLLDLLGLRYLTLHSRSRGTSGCPTKVVQSCNTIAVSCASIGGGPEPIAVDNIDPTELDPYNREGNLVVWSGSKQLSIAAHWKDVMNNQDTLYAPQKFYTVNDVAFDPLRPHIMVSSGMDCTVHVWRLMGKQEEGSMYQVHKPIPYRDVPNDLSFRSNSSILAISNYNGYIYIVQLEDNPSCFKRQIGLKVSREQCPNQKTGAFLWGDGNTMYASSESIDNTNCRHVAFDVEVQSALYDFHTLDSGDDMALNESKSQLALVTNSGEGHYLRLYDVARHNGELPIETITMPPAENREELEINKTSFSPDGILLAVARNDNTAYIYDTRFMKEELYALRHVGESVSVEREREYGMTAALWHDGVRGKGLGLVTSSVDGCVRFWDTRVAHDDATNGTVIAQTDYDIACISMGDPQKGEHRLVVGDFGGGVYVYD